MQFHIVSVGGAVDQRGCVCVFARVCVQSRDQLKAIFHIFSPFLTMYINFSHINVIVSGLSLGVFQLRF